MIKQFTITLGLIFTLSAFSYGQHQNQVIKDSRLHRDVLVGLCNDQGLQGKLFGPSFKYQYTHYTPSASKVAVLKRQLNQIRFTLVFGSWCGDSKMQVGRFYKILDQAGYDHSKVRLIAVDRSLQAGEVNIAALKITRIPTIILYKNGAEIGRIVESPMVSLEADLVNLLNKKK